MTFLYIFYVYTHGFGPVLKEFQHLSYDGSHVVILVFGQSAAEYHVGLLVGPRFILFVHGLIAGIVDGVKRFHAVEPLGGLFARYHRAGIGVYGVAKSLEVLMLYHAGIGH